MLTKLIQKLAEIVEKDCEKKGRYFVITGKQDEPYLIRYFLFTSSKFSVYIHRFMRSDEDTYHDHPFSFLGYVISKGYLEERAKMNRKTGKWKYWSTVRKPGSYAFRKATDVLMVSVGDKKYTWEERRSAPLTIILRGPLVREWGFWPAESDKDYTDTLRAKGASERKFVVWNEFLGVDVSSEREGA